MSPKKSITEYLDELQVAPMRVNSWAHWVTEKTSLRALQSLLPFATKSQISSAAVTAWLTFIMPKLQHHGMNFHDAFSKAAQLWNASANSVQHNFRIPYEWSLIKRRKKEKGGDKENEFHIRKILEIPDTKQETIARSLGVELIEIWPEKVLWRNQYKRR